MGLDSYSNRFTTTTSSATVDQSITGVGFQPKVVIFQWSPDTSPLNVTTPYKWGMGFASSSSQSRCINSESDDALGTSNCASNLQGNTGARSAGKCIQSYKKFFGAFTFNEEAHLKSFDSDGFTLTWTAVDTSTAWNIHFLCLGGSDITDVNVDDFNTTTDASGDQTVNTNGFVPDMVYIITSGSTSDGIKAHAVVGTGMATGPSNEGTTAVCSRDNLGTTETYRYQRTDKFLAILDSGTADTLDGEFDFKEFHATNGFTMTVQNQMSSAFHCAYLAIKGGQWEVGNDTSATGTGNKDGPALGFDPEIALTSAFDRTATTSVVAHNRIALGFRGGAGSAHQLDIWAGDTDAAGTTSTDHSNFDNSIDFYDFDAPDTDNFAVDRGTLSYGTLKYIINYSIADATARQFIYMVGAPDAVVADIPNRLYQVEQAVSRASTY